MPSHSAGARPFIGRRQCGWRRCCSSAASRRRSWARCGGAGRARAPRSARQPRWGLSHGLALQRPERAPRRWRSPRCAPPMVMRSRRWRASPTKRPPLGPRRMGVARAPWKAAAPNTRRTPCTRQHRLRTCARGCPGRRGRLRRRSWRPACRPRPCAGWRAWRPTARLLPPTRSESVIVNALASCLATYAFPHVTPAANAAAAAALACSVSGEGLVELAVGAQAADSRRAATAAEAAHEAAACASLARAAQGLRAALARVGLRQPPDEHDATASCCLLLDVLEAHVPEHDRFMRAGGGAAAATSPPAVSSSPPAAASRPPAAVGSPAAASSSSSAAGASSSPAAAANSSPAAAASSSITAAASSPAAPPPVLAPPPAAAPAKRCAHCGLGPAPGGGRLQVCNGCRAQRLDDTEDRHRAGALRMWRVEGVCIAGAAPAASRASRADGYRRAAGGLADAARPGRGAPRRCRPCG